MKIAVGTSTFAENSNVAMEVLEKAGLEVVRNPYRRKMTKEETIQHLQGAVGALAGLEVLDEDVFSACPDLKVIVRVGIGMDNVDIEAANRYGIKVSNTPDGPTDAVAEMTLAALLSILHNIPSSNTDMHERVWKKRMGSSIREMTVFVIGCGRIGTKVSELLSYMGAKILAYDKFAPERSNCTMEEGLATADVITLHASGKDVILGEDELSRTKKGVIILNSARGGLIDEGALAAALESGQVGYFWGDTFWEEPYTGRICDIDNALLTPHICTYTTLCREQMESQAARILIGDLDVRI